MRNCYVVPVVVKANNEFDAGEFIEGERDPSLNYAIVLTVGKPLRITPAMTSWEDHNG